MTQKSKSSKVVTLILMILAMNTIYMLPYLMYTIHHYRRLWVLLEEMLTMVDY